MLDEEKKEEIFAVNATSELSDCLGKWTYEPSLKAYVLGDVSYAPKGKVPRAQKLTIYVPEEYMAPDGSLKQGFCGKYTTKTAPFVFENGAAGYMEMPAEPIGTAHNFADKYLARGMVYVQCGCSGRGSRDENGTWVGKAPWTLVDFKTAIRFLRHNRACLPGQIDKMISIGWSAGGAMSALLSVSGDNPVFDPYLEAEGAFMDESDAIYAGQIYCPIIDLEHADAAYEWQLGKQDHCEPNPHFGQSGSISEFQMILSKQLAADYVGYFNSLALKDPKTGEPLVISADGRSGSGYEMLVGEIQKSADLFFGKLQAGELNDVEDISGNKSVGCAGYIAEPTTPAQYIAGDYIYWHKVGFQRGQVNVEKRQGISKADWLSWDGTKAHFDGLDGYQTGHILRKKPSPSFDHLDNTSGENQLFGNEQIDCRHYSALTLQSLKNLKKARPELAEECDKYIRDFEADLASEDLQKQLDLINPLRYIDTECEKKGCASGLDLKGAANKQAQHYRIHVGACDTDTSYLMSMILAVKLQNAGFADVEYKIVWDRPHCEADYGCDCEDWIDRVLAE